MRGKPPAVDARRVRHRPRRHGAAEDSLQLRRVGVGVLPAAAVGRAPGDGAAGRPQGSGLPRRHRAGAWRDHDALRAVRSEEHKSELQSLMSISYSVFCWKKKMNKKE